MKQLEDCIEKKYVISFMLGQGLPKTDCELVAAGKIWKNQHLASMRKQSPPLVYWKKLREEFYALIDDLHAILSSSPLENDVVLIDGSEDDMIIDLTINFPKNMSPLKKQKEWQSAEQYIQG